MVITLITIEIVKELEQEKIGESVGIIKSKVQHINRHHKVILTLLNENWLLMHIYLCKKAKITMKN